MVWHHSNSSETPEDKAGPTCEGERSRQGGPWLKKESLKKYDVSIQHLIQGNNTGSEAEHTSHRHTAHTHTTAGIFTGRLPHLFIHESLVSFIENLLASSQKKFPLPPFNWKSVHSSGHFSIEGCHCPLGVPSFAFKHCCIEWKHCSGI